MRTCLEALLGNLAVANDVSYSITRCYSPVTGCDQHLQSRKSAAYISSGCTARPSYQIPRDLQSCFSKKISAMGNQHTTIANGVSASDSALYQPTKPKVPRHSSPSAAICTRSRRGSLRRSSSLKKAHSIRRNSRGYARKHRHARAARRAEALMERKVAEEEARMIEAATRGDAEEVEMFVDNGVDVNATDANQMTALHHAAKHARDEAIKFLLDRGANANATDLKGGFSPLHWVVINADPQICCVDHVDASIVALARAGGDVNCTDFNFATPLHIAAQKDNKACVDALIRLGANPELTDITGRDCFQIAKSDSMRDLIGKLYRMKQDVVYHVLEIPRVVEAPRPRLLTVPRPSSRPLPPLPPLPPFSPAPKRETIYHVLERPLPTPRSTEIPPPLPPHRSKKAPAPLYHVLEVSPSPESPPPTPPRRRKSRFV